MSTITMYGIKNCQTMKKAMTYLENNDINYQFHDYKKQGIDADTLTSWLKQKQRDEIINKRGTTWRKLAEEDKKLDDDQAAIALMIKQPSMIKRPALMVDGTLYLGFDDVLYDAIF